MANELKFDMKPVESKPVRTYAKGSKYDPIIDDFVQSSHSLVQITTEKEPNYLRTQLAKRIVVRELNNIVVSVSNNQVFLEKITES